jgi:hypothetical protein
VDAVPDPLLLRKSGSAGNRINGMSLMASPKSGPDYSDFITK